MKQALAAKEQQVAEAKAKLDQEQKKVAPATAIRFQEADIGQVLEFYAELTGKKLLKSPQLPAGATITIHNPAQLSKDEKIDTMNTVLGLNGIVIKAHGSAREKAFMNAIRVATETIHYKINETIEREISRANETIPSSKPAVHAPAAAEA